MRSGLTAIQARGLLVVAVLGPAGLLTAGCGSHSGDPSGQRVTSVRHINNTAVLSSTSVTARPRHRRLTNPQIATAKAAARRELRREPATLKSASATIRRGVIRESNTGATCRSGRVLHVTLIGSFPHIVVGGTPGQTHTAVHAVDLAVDAASGRTCRLGVQTGSVHRSRGATVLPLGSID